MPARIEAAHAVRGGPENRSSRELAAAAARVCLDQAQCPADRVGLITYTGILRDDHIQEPAGAPFLQRAIGANPVPGERYPYGSFSFDVSELLAAVEVAAGFIESGQADRALVIAADGGLPGSEASGIIPAAGAILLRPDSESGFGAFRSRNHPEWSDGLSRRAFWDGRQHRLRTEFRDDWLELCAEAISELAKEFLADQGELSEQVVVISSQSPRGLPIALEKKLGISCVQAEIPGPDELYTAGPIAAMIDGAERFRSAEQVLFATAVPGLIATVGLYHKQPGEPF